MERFKPIIPKFLYDRLEEKEKDKYLYSTPLVPEEPFIPKHPFKKFT